MSKRINTLFAARDGFSLVKSIIINTDITIDLTKEIMLLYEGDNEVY